MANEHLSTCHQRMQGLDSNRSKRAHSASLARHRNHTPPKQLAQPPHAHVPCPSAPAGKRGTPAHPNHEKVTIKAGRQPTPARVPSLPAPAGTRGTPALPAPTPIGHNHPRYQPSAPARAPSLLGPAAWQSCHPTPAFNKHTDHPHTPARALSLPSPAGTRGGTRTAAPAAAPTRARGTAQRWRPAQVELMVDGSRLGRCGCTV